MRRPFFVLLIVLLIIILMAAEIYIIKSASDFEPKVDAVYAKIQIPAGTVITQDMVQVKSVAVSAAHRQSPGKAGDVVGKTARYPIEQDEIILFSKIGDIGEKDEIKLEMKSNRLFSLEFKPDQANGWQIAEGGRVDLIFVSNETKKTLGADAVNTLSDAAGQREGCPEEFHDASEVVVIKGVRIAALVDERGKRIKDRGKDPAPRYVCFEVTPRQAEFLAYAKGNGRVEMAAGADTE